MSNTTHSPEVSPDERTEANSCIALGAGVALLGASAAAVTGAVCPLCVLIAPGLIGYGSYKKWKANKPKTIRGSDVEL